MIEQRLDRNLAYKYVCYGRMSTDSQNARSPKQQFDTIDRTLKRAGLPWVHVSDYRDDGISGRVVEKRIGFTTMLTDIKTGRTPVDLILVDTLERFGRMKNLDAVRRDLADQFGVLVLTADSGFADPTSTEGQALGIVESIRATQDGRVKAHNVLRGKRDAAKQKQWPGGAAPMGYKLDSVMRNSNTGPAEVAYRRLVPNPEAASLVKEIFLLADEKGWGDVRIARQLNSQPELVAKYKRFHPDTIGRLLSNPIYIGTLRFGRVSTDIANDRRVIRRNKADDVLLVPDFCEPLVSREIWDKVQTVRKARGEAIKCARARHTRASGKQIVPLAAGMTLKYPLTGLVRCGVCGASMRPNRSGRRSSCTSTTCARLIAAAAAPTVSTAPNTGSGRWCSPRSVHTYFRRRTRRATCPRGSRRWSKRCRRCSNGKRRISTPVRVRSWSRN
jgi:site-specific DNA recombinase